MTAITTKAQTMPLFSKADRRNPVTEVPHRLLFADWKGRLQPLELQAIDVELDRLVRSKRGAEIVTAHWLPREISPLGRLDWEGTALGKVRNKACEGNRSRTGWCFALFLWEHMIRRPEAWQFVLRDLHEMPLAATRYCRCPQIRQAASHGADPALAGT